MIRPNTPVLLKADPSGHQSRLEQRTGEIVPPGQNEPAGQSLVVLGREQKCLGGHGGGLFHVPALQKLDIGQVSPPEVVLGQYAPSGHRFWDTEPAGQLYMPAHLSVHDRFEGHSL